MTGIFCKNTGKESHTMAELKTIDLYNGVKLNYFTDANFKTMRIAINMLVPMTKDTVAKNGLLPAIVSRASREFPDYTALGERLAELYGAHIDSSVGKLGGYQMLSIAVGGIANRYAFGNENMEGELLKLLLSVVFNPLKDDEGLLPEDGFQQERRQVLEVFDAEYNDKIIYARRRAMEIMFAGMPQGINRYGSPEEVKALDRCEVTEAWEKLLKTAQFEIFVLGDCSPNIELFEKAFKGYGNKYVNHGFATASTELKEVTEEMQIAQSKLVMGYRADMAERSSYVYKLMNAVLGGSPSSKLFTNVREKMSLCYYCSSGFDSTISTMMIESGVETENIEKARAAIEAQLKDMQDGNISDEELNHARLAICNVYRSITDSLNSIEYWYLQRAMEDMPDSPQKAEEIIMTVTKEEIMAAAKSLTLDTVYVLRGKAE